MKEGITKRIDTLNDELATRQESIDLLKGRLKSQITSFKETIAEVLDKDTSCPSLYVVTVFIRHRFICGVHKCTSIVMNIPTSSDNHQITNDV